MLWLAGLSAAAGGRAISRFRSGIERGGPGHGRQVHGSGLRRQVQETREREGERQGERGRERERKREREGEGEGDVSPA